MCGVVIAFFTSQKLIQRPPDVTRLFSIPHDKRSGYVTTSRRIEQPTANSIRDRSNEPQIYSYPISPPSRVQLIDISSDDTYSPLKNAAPLPRPASEMLFQS